jgi:hypothetical protein
LIQLAGYRIDLEQDRIDQVLESLSKECIKEEWQLRHIDSIQWNLLKAPIGLVASVRACLEEHEEDRNLTMLNAHYAMLMEEQLNLQAHGTQNYEIHEIAPLKGSDHSGRRCSMGSTMDSSTIATNPQIAAMGCGRLSFASSAENSLAAPKLPERRVSISGASKTSASSNSSMYRKLHCSNSQLPAVYAVFSSTQSQEEAEPVTIFNILSPNGSEHDQAEGREIQNPFSCMDSDGNCSFSFGGSRSSLAPPTLPIRRSSVLATIPA